MTLTLVPSFCLLITYLLNHFPRFQLNSGHNLRNRPAKGFLELYKSASISSWNLAAASTVCNFLLCPDVLKNVSGRGWKILAVVVAVNIGCPTRTARLASDGQ